MEFPVNYWTRHGCNDKIFVCGIKMCHLSPSIRKISTNFLFCPLFGCVAKQILICNFPFFVWIEEKKKIKRSKANNEVHRGTTAKAQQGQDVDNHLQEQTTSARRQQNKKWRVFLASQKP
jgi:hypothetical protein